MGYEVLRQAVWEANREIVKAGLVVLTWGNASGADRAAGVMAIKPSGVDYDAMRPEDMVEPPKPFTLRKQINTTA